jgi:glycosyltransferase involved in cell wall biosynthesis
MKPEIKKKIAVLGGGAHTIPNYRALLKLLSHNYNLFLFSEFHLGHEWTVKEYPIYSVRRTRINGRWREFLFFLLALKGCLTKRIDLIHSHSTFPSGLVAIIIGKLLRIPVLICLDAAEGTSIPDIKFGDALNPKRIKVNRWVLNQADAITVLTKFQENEIRKSLGTSRDMNLIPRGVDLQKHFPSIDKKISKPIRFLNVAYIHPVKDQETLLRAFQIIVQEVDATLTLVGEDYEKGRLKKLVSDLNIERYVRFVGFVPNESISSYYLQADILLHTSRYESMAAVVIEAMASGVLVCGTHVGIMADLSDQCCITVAPQDFRGLASKVLDLINSIPLQNKLRIQALDWTKAYSLDWTADQYKLIYHRLTAD